MLKKIPILLLAASTLAFADGNTATQTVSAGINVIKPIQVTKLADLNFGSLVIDTTTFSPGYLTVGTDNLINGTQLGNGTWLFKGSNHPTANAAQFLISGQDGYQFGFAALDFLVLGPAGQSMSIHPLLGVVDTVTHGQTPATVSVGGTLSLAGKPKPGVYSGTFAVTASYL
jgi:spore coat protein U-like protein